jgi:hypothetical protein
MKNICKKCGKYGNIQEHHILPRSTFGENDEKIQLCPNCHVDYHDQLGLKNISNPSIEFHFNKFFRWLAGLSIVAILFYLLG